MTWWTSLFRRRTFDTQLDAELRFHIEELTEAYIARGLTPAEARSLAMQEFGGKEQVKEELRDLHRIATMENILSNLKSAFRLMRKSPSFALTVILTLALGIGGNSAVFSAIDAVLLRPLPFPEADRIMTLHQSNPRKNNPETFVAPVRLQDWSRLNSTFQAITGYYTDDTTSISGELPEKKTVAYVAPRFLEVWGIAPVLGRDFRPEEQRFNGPNAILISERWWRRQFAADPHIIGKALRLGSSSFTVVGVMPSSFQFPVRDTDIWSSIPVDAPYAKSRNFTWFTVVGRLKSGVTQAQAAANLNVVQAQLGKQYPETDAGLAIGVVPLKEQTVGGVRRSLWILFGSVTLLLLIACTNIAALLLARTTDRAHEMAIRTSLGASRISVIAQLLTETLVLALAGSAVGLFGAWGAVRAFHAYAKSIPRVEEITLDWRIVLYTIVCASAATVLCGLFPAIRATRRNVFGAIAQAGRTQVSSRNPAQWTLVGVQVALAVTLLVGAGLLLRSFQALGRVAPGFDASHVLAFHISGNYGETTDMPGLTKRIDRTLTALRSVPGVEAAATSVTLPGADAARQTELQITERKADAEGKVITDSRFVSQDYFNAVKIPLLAGEACRESGTTPSVVVNRSFANAYFSGRQPLGYHVEFQMSGISLPSSEIRGVVADAREGGLNKAPSPTVYWCISAPTPDPHYLVRTQGDPNAMAETIRRTIHEIEPSRSVFEIMPLDAHLQETFGDDRLRTFLLSLFAFTAVSLACVGIYGTLNYFVTVRRREVGLRLALGAERREIVGRFLFQGLGVSLLGCVAGLFLAALTTQVLSGMLYDVKPSDPATFAAVALLILTVAAAASLLPAVRAARVEPMQVLRSE